MEGCLGQPALSLCNKVSVCPVVLWSPDSAQYNNLADAVASIHAHAAHPEHAIIPQSLQANICQTKILWEYQLA